MRLFWTILFGTVPLLGVWFYWWAWKEGYWLPDDVSTHGHEIDRLFNIIMWITGVVFVATEAALGWFIWKYSRGEKALYTHGNHKVEIIWTVVPAIILAYIVWAQYGTWANIKYQRNFPDVPVLAEVTAQQFDWRFRYAGADGVYNTPDDVHSVYELHVPVNEPVVVDLLSRDVLHSFFLPQLRVKQDAVPGLRIPIWFEATKIGAYDLACAELCGWGHYKMAGKLIVESRADFDAWLSATAAEQERSR